MIQVLLFEADHPCRTARVFHGLSMGAGSQPYPSAGAQAVGSATRFGLWFSVSHDLQSRPAAVAVVKSLGRPPAVARAVHRHYVQLHQSLRVNWIVSRINLTSAPFSANLASAIVVLVVVMLLDKLRGKIVPTNTHGGGHLSLQLVLHHQHGYDHEISQFRPFRIPENDAFRPTLCAFRTVAP